MPLPTFTAVRAAIESTLLGQTTRAYPFARYFRVEVWPAIDLRGGKCVRLQQGDYARETVFGDDPATIARQWVEQGASISTWSISTAPATASRGTSWLSLNPQSSTKVFPSLRERGLSANWAAGFAMKHTIRELLALGLCRLVIGTSAIREPDWFRAMCRLFPRRLVLGIDARDGKVATHGWLHTSDVSAIELARQFAAEPLAGIIYTDIATDGMLAGPNCPAMAEMQAAVDLPVIASGGVTTAADVADLAAIPMAGCIIGRALYEGSLTLPEAIAAAG